MEAGGDAGVSGGSGSCEAICCCSSSSAGAGNDVEDPGADLALALAVVWSLLLVGRAGCRLSLGDFTNRSTKEGLALSFGRRPSMLSLDSAAAPLGTEAPATNPGFELRDGSSSSSSQQRQPLVPSTLMPMMLVRERARSTATRCVDEKECEMRCCLSLISKELCYAAISSPCNQNTFIHSLTNTQACCT